MNFEGGNSSEILVGFAEKAFMSSTKPQYTGLLKFAIDLRTINESALCKATGNDVMMIMESFNSTEELV